MRAATLCLSLFAVLLLSSAGCRGDYKAQTRIGPAKPAANPTVVLFPVPCHSSDDKCEDAYGDAVTALLSTELEFSGMRIIDAEKLVRTARTREDESAELKLYREKVMSAKSRRQVGSIFEDLPPQARRELLREARANGMVTAAIKMLPRGSGNNWIVEVQVRYGTAEGELVWVSRCKHESYWNERDSWSIEQAAKCAVKGGLERAGGPAPSAAATQSGR